MPFIVRTGQYECLQEDTELDFSHFNASPQKMGNSEILVIGNEATETKALATGVWIDLSFGYSREEKFRAFVPLSFILYRVGYVRMYMLASSMPN